jgi:hypothetical protein
VRGGEVILALLLASAPLLGGESHGQDEYVLALDPRFGTEGGVRTISSAFSAVMLYDEALSGRLTFDERAWWKKTLAITGRAAKLLFVDFTLASLATVFIHEVYGHGARGREAGLWPTYVFSVPPPWGWLLDPHGPRFLGATSNAYSFDADRDQLMVAAGIEANYYTAHFVTAGAMQRGGSLRYGDALLYMVSKAAYVGSFLQPGAAPKDSRFATDDVEEYVQGLAARFNLDRPNDPQRLRWMLFYSYIGNVLDPMLWLSAYHTLVSYGWFGAREARLPSIAAGPLRLFPSTRYNLTPFGPEHYLDLFGFNDAFTGNVYVRAGSSGLAFYGGFGARLFRYEPVPWLRLGAELDVWLQPQTVFNVRNLYDRPLTAGVNYAVSAELLLYGPFGVLGRLAYKTRGYAMGQPLGEGVHGYFGVFLRP